MGLAGHPGCKRTLHGGYIARCVKSRYAIMLLAILAQSRPNHRTKYLDEFLRAIVAMNVSVFILHQSVTRQKTANHKKKDIFLSLALH